MAHRRQPLREGNLNAGNKPPKKIPKVEPAPIEQNARQYDSLLKAELQKECTARGLFKTGNKPDLIARLESADKAKRDKHANAKNAPISKEEAAKHPIGAKIPPSKARAAFGKNDPEEKILKRGPTGAPVYDELGFELDYAKVARSRSRRPGWGNMRSDKFWDKLDQEQRDDDRKAEIMGTEKSKVSAVTTMAWDDRISRDLGIPFHKVEMEDFEEWYRRGFRADGREFEASNMSEEEQDRLTELETGSAFRK
jgi:SAP domain